MFEFLVFCVIIFILWSLRRATRVLVKDSRKLAEMKAIEWHDGLNLMDDSEIDARINAILNPSTTKKAK